MTYRHRKPVIVGARVGTPAARRVRELKPFIGRMQSDFLQSVAFGCFPAGTIARKGEQWVEVQRKANFRLMVAKIEQPEAGEVTRGRR